MKKFKGWLLPIGVFTIVFVLLSVMLAMPHNDGISPAAEITGIGIADTIPQNGEKPVENSNFIVGDVVVSYCHVENYNSPTSLKVTWETPDGNKETDNLSVTRSDYYYSAINADYAGTYVVTWEISGSSPVKTTVDVK